MPVEFLSDDEAAAYDRFAGVPSRADLERVFFLDDADLDLVGKHRGEHIRAGFALQLVTVRWLGTFLEDPLDVPGVVLEFVAGQLGLADPSQVKRYTERDKTRFEHQWEIRRDRGYREFGDAEGEFAEWAAARSRASGDGPKAIFTDGLGWLRERKILLPGVSRLARLVASVREEATRRLWEELAALPDPVQRRALDRLLEVPPGSRLSDLERWRKGPVPRGSGPSLVKFLDRVAQIRSSGGRWTGCWRSRRGHGCRTWSGGARARCRAGAARRWSSSWIGWPRSACWVWPGWVPKRGYRRGGWPSCPATG